MLHTNRESYRIKSIQQQGPEGTSSLDQNKETKTLTENTLNLLKQKDPSKLGFKERSEIKNFLDKFTNKESDKIDFSGITNESEKKRAEEIFSLVKTIWAKEKISEISQELTQMPERQNTALKETSKDLTEGPADTVLARKTIKVILQTTGNTAPENLPTQTQATSLVQDKLVQLGLLQAKDIEGNNRGQFGGKTEAALSEFFKKNNIEGRKANEITRETLNQILSIQVTINNTPEPKPQPQVTEKTETPSTIVAKRVHKGTDGKLPEISDAEKKATRSLQIALTTLGLYTGKDDSIFGQGTEDAIKKFLASADLRGNISANTNPQEVTQVLITRAEEAATKAQRIAAAPQDSVPTPKPQRRPVQAPALGASDIPVRKPNVAPRGTNNPSRLASEVVKDLETVNFFLDAHNRTYGERNSLISNRNGIVGVVWQLSNPDSRRLAGELGMSEDRIKAYGASLGLDNSKVTDGLIRMALIAVVSGILSGGASVALEILGINVSRDYKKGPEMKKILELMGRKGDITSKRRDVLMDPRTTSRDVEAVGKAMRGKNLLPNNIRADVKKILSSDFFLFDIIADIFGNSQKKQMNALIDQFEKARNLDEAEFILTQIVQIATEEYYKNYPTGSANNILDSLADSLKAIRDLKAKKDKIEGKGFDRKRYERETGTIQAILDATYGKPEPQKGFKEVTLHTSQSYAPALPQNLNPTTLGDVLQKMANTTIKGDKYTILANLMRGVNFHTGISFTPDEFLVAFQNMRWLNNKERKDLNRTILSNTGRQRNQSFNGLNPADGVAIMELNGQKVYFRGGCTNVLTNIEDIPTVLEMSTSIPIFAPISTGLPGWGGGGAGKIGTQPGEDTSTLTTGPGTTTTTTTGGSTGGVVSPLNPMMGL